MPKRIAILFYGQPRLVPNYTEPLDRLKNAFEIDSNQTLFDIYIHTWIKHDNNFSKDIGSYAKWFETGTVNKNVYSFINDYYKPKKIILEQSRQFNFEEYFHKDTTRMAPFKQEWDDTQLSNMISQVYSINSVCNLIEKNDESFYDYYILVRFDLLMDENFKLNLSSFDLTNKILMNRDFINIFDNSSLSYFQNIMKYNKENPIKEEINAEIVRFNIFKENNFSFIGSFPNKDYTYFKLDNLVEQEINMKLIRNKYLFFPSFQNIISFQSCILHSINDNGMIYEIISDKHIRVVKVKNDNSFNNIYKFVSYVNDKQENGTLNFKLKFLTDNTEKLFSKIDDRIIPINDIEKNVWYDLSLSYTKNDKVIFFLFLDNIVEEVIFELILN